LGVGAGGGCRELGVEVGVVVTEEAKVGACILGGRGQRGAQAWFLGSTFWKNKSNQGKEFSKHDMEETCMQI
jgi:hypothetical protein